MKRALLVSLIIPVLLVAPVFAEQKPYVPDRNHCQVNFIGEAMLISAHGFFEKWDIDAQIDRSNLENSSVTITIDAASLNTRVDPRDKHLRSPDFLDVAKFPEIKFVSLKVIKLDDQNLNVVGNLTVKGVTKAVTAPVKITFLRETDGRFKGEFEIKRQDYGINYAGRMNPVEDMVKIQFDFHLQDKQAAEARKAAPQPPPKPPIQ